MLLKARLFFLLKTIFLSLFQENFLDLKNNLRIRTFFLAIRNILLLKKFSYYEKIERICFEMNLSIEVNFSQKQGQELLSRSDEYSFLRNFCPYVLDQRRC